MRASKVATVVPFDQEPADGAGDDAAHSTRVDRIRSQLEHSRATSRARRRKLTVPPLVVGGLGSLGGLTLIMLDQGEWTWRIYAGFVLGMCTSWLVVLPVLPVDQRLVLGATYLMLACNFLLAAVFLALQALPGATRVFGVADCRVLYDAHDAFARVAWHGAFHLMFVLYYIAGLARWYRAPPRQRTWATAVKVGERSDAPPDGAVSAPPASDAVTSRWMLRRLWKVFGAFYVITGCGAAYALGAGLHFVPAYTSSARLIGEVGILLVSAPLAGFFWIPGVLQRVQATLAAGGENVRTAASIASLLAEDMAPEAAIRSGRQRMRAILASSLTREVFETNAADNAWYERSVPAHLEMVDAFVSHSWHDDPQHKWTELHAWCERFAGAHGRQPYLWIDKCCIDQSNIDADLPSLPVFLAGCNRLLILAGDTYLQRLWCVVELFVFVQMGGTEVEMGLLPGVCGDQGPCGDDATRFGARFDARACDCFLAADYDRLLSCIEGACGTLGDFNRLVRELLLSAPKATYSELRTAELDAAARAEHRSGAAAAGCSSPIAAGGRLLARALSSTPRSPRDRGTDEPGGATSASDGASSARSWSSRSRSPLHEPPKALARSASDSRGLRRQLAALVGAHRAAAPADASSPAPPPADTAPAGAAPGGGTLTSARSGGATTAAAGGQPERTAALVLPAGAPTPPRPRRAPRARLGRARAEPEASGERRRALRRRRRAHQRRRG